MQFSRIEQTQNSDLIKLILLPISKYLSLTTNKNQNYNYSTKYSMEQYAISNTEFQNRYLLFRNLKRGITKQSPSARTEGAH